MVRGWCYIRSDGLFHLPLYSAVIGIGGAVVPVRKVTLDGKPIPDDWDGQTYTQFVGACPDSPKWRAMVRGGILDQANNWDGSEAEIDAADSEVYGIVDSVNFEVVFKPKVCLAYVDEAVDYNLVGSYAARKIDSVNDPCDLVKLQNGDLELRKEGWYRISTSVLMVNLVPGETPYLDVWIRVNGAQGTVLRSYAHCDGWNRNMAFSLRYFNAGDTLNVLYRNGEGTVRTRGNHPNGYVVGVEEICG